MWFICMLNWALCKQTSYACYLIKLIQAKVGAQSKVWCQCSQNNKKHASPLINPCQPSIVQVLLLNMQQGCIDAKDFVFDFGRWDTFAKPEVIRVKSSVIIIFLKMLIRQLSNQLDDQEPSLICSF